MSTLYGVLLVTIMCAFEEVKKMHKVRVDSLLFCSGHFRFLFTVHTNWVLYCIVLCTLPCPSIPSTEQSLKHLSSSSTFALQVQD